MPTFIFNKLIRDKILQLHIDAGHSVKYTTISGAKLKEKLRAKLHEEADEIPILDVANDETVEEIADVQQVLDDLKKLYGISDDHVKSVQSSKFTRKGGFVDGVFIETVELPEDDEWVAYYRASPEKYPELGSE